MTLVIMAHITWMAVNPGYKYGTMLKSRNFIGPLLMGGFDSRDLAIRAASSVPLYQDFSCCTICEISLYKEN